MHHLVAVEGRLLPREDMRTRFITGTEAEPTVVPTSAYYRRAIARGDVLDIPPPPTKKKGA